MANFCRNCGTQVNMDSGFCPSCGNSIETPTNNGQEISNNFQNQSVNTTEKDNTVTAFVLSLLGFLCCAYLAIPGLIMSILSLQKMNKGELSNKNKGLAIAGIVIGAIGIIVMINNIINPNSAVTELVNELMDI